VKALKMAVVFGECGRECLSGPGNTVCFPATLKETTSSVPQLRLLEFSLFPKISKLLRPSNFQVNIPQSKREHAKQQELRNETGGLGETEQRKGGIGQ
jgi:hypothetical protein